LIARGTEKVKNPPRRTYKDTEGLFNMFRKNSVFQPHELFLSESLWGAIVVELSTRYRFEQPFLSLSDESFRSEIPSLRPSYDEKFVGIYDSSIKMVKISPS
jgi:hypothetical protein